MKYIFCILFHFKSQQHKYWNRYKLINNNKNDGLCG